MVKRRERMFLKMVHGRYAALHARQGHFSCRMYAERPAPCRVVEPAAASAATRAGATASPTLDGHGARGGRQLGSYAHSDGYAGPGGTSTADPEASRQSTCRRS